MKVLIIGLARHGKDEMAEILHEALGLTFASSSKMALDIFLFDKLSPEFGYKTKEECFEDRKSQEKRNRWKKEISEYNTPDKARLARKIFSKHDIYVGLRDREELNAARAERLFDLCVWVDATDRVGLSEDASSIEVTKEDADIAITNNKSIEDFKEKVLRLFMLLPTHTPGVLIPEREYTEEEVLEFRKRWEQASSRNSRMIWNPSGKPLCSMETLPSGAKQYVFKGDLHIKDAPLWDVPFSDFACGKRGNIEIHIEGNYIEASASPEATTFKELGIDADKIDNLTAFSTFAKNYIK
jgi:hypothetical protein